MEAESRGDKKKATVISDEAAAFSRQVSEDEEEQARKSSIANSLFIANGLFMTATMMLIPSRPAMVLALKKGDTQAAAKMLGFMSSCGAAVELFLNPAFGRLSDVLGRKPFLLLAPAIRATFHMLVATFSQSTPIQFADRIITAAMVFTFQAPVNACLSDLYSGQRLAMAMSRNQTFFGLGCAIGPIIGARLPGRKAFIGASLLFLASLSFMAVKIPETLTDEHRKEFDIKACNPFRFLRLFRGKTMSALSGTLALQSFGDFPNFLDFNFLFLRTVLGYGQAEVGNVNAAYGVATVVGGEAVAQVIRTAGQRVATLIGNTSWILGLCLLGTTRSPKQVAAALAVMTFGIGRAVPVVSYLQKHGEASLMGKSEILSAKMNMEAIIKIFAPVLYAKVFAWATSKGRNLPGLPYFIVCLITFAGQLLFTSCNPDINVPKKLERRVTTML